MTYNIAHGAGIDRRLDLARTARVIAAAGADVVGLQEVDRHYSSRSDFVDQAAWLGERLGMHVTFGANIDLDPPAPGSPRRQYGNAILSRAPIVESANIHLPRTDGHEQRGLLSARTVLQGVSWLAYVTHLQNDDAAERLAQADAIVAAVDRSAPAVVLTGDLNATPETPEVRRLTGVFVDAWAAQHTGGGSTVANPITTRRIDYVLAGRAVRVRSSTVSGSLTAIFASDHRPVVADLDAPPAVA